MVLIVSMTRIVVTSVTIHVVIVVSILWLLLLYAGVHFVSHLVFIMSLRSVLIKGPQCCCSIRSHIVQANARLASFPSFLFEFAVVVSVNMLAADHRNGIGDS